jgi:hypothetical protein
MRILTLLARHGTSDYPDADAKIDELFARQLSSVEHDTIIIDNELAGDFEETIASGRMVLGGSNDYGEFSAWDRGVDRLGGELASYDLVHLATSAFDRLYVGYLGWFEPDMLRSILGRGAALGHIDYYDDPVMLCGRVTQAWLRTSWIFLPPRELQLLGSLVSIGAKHSLFSGDPAAPFAADAPLSRNYQQYILDWLTGSGTGQGVQWHSRFDLSSQTLSRFEAKATAILNEQMLGIRLRAQGCAMLDATWLAARRVELDGWRPLGAIPDWRTQVTARALAT